MAMSNTSKVLLLAGALWLLSSSGSPQGPPAEPDDLDDDPEPNDAEPDDEADEDDQGDQGDEDDAKCDDDVSYLYEGPPLMGPDGDVGQYNALNAVLLNRMTAKDIDMSATVLTRVINDDLVPHQIVAAMPKGLCLRGLVAQAVQHDLTHTRALAVWTWWLSRGAAATWPNNNPLEVDRLKLLEDYFRIHAGQAPLYGQELKY